jgi:hypothetical protein
VPQLFGCQRLQVLLSPIHYQNSVRSPHGFPLVWAAKHSSEVTIRRGLEAGASTHSCRYNLRRLLAAAVDNSHETLMRLVLEQNNDPSIFIERQTCELCEGQESELALEIHQILPRLTRVSFIVISITPR